MFMCLFDLVNGGFWLLSGCWGEWIGGVFGHSLQRHKKDPVKAVTQFRAPGSMLYFEIIHLSHICIIPGN